MRWWCLVLCLQGVAGRWSRKLSSDYDFLRAALAKDEATSAHEAASWPAPRSWTCEGTVLSAGRERGDGGDRPTEPSGRRRPDAGRRATPSTVADLRPTSKTADTNCAWSSSGQTKRRFFVVDPGSSRDASPFFRFALLLVPPRPRPNRNAAASPGFVGVFIRASAGLSASDGRRAAQRMRPRRLREESGPHKGRARRLGGRKQRDVILGDAILPARES